MIPVEVSSYSGYTYAQEPRSFTYEGRCYQVSSIKAVWREPEGLFFRVEVGGEDLLVITYKESADKWYLSREGQIYEESA